MSAFFLQPIGKDGAQSMRLYLQSYVDRMPRGSSQFTPNQRLWYVSSSLLQSIGEQNPEGKTLAEVIHLATNTVKNHFGNDPSLKLYAAYTMAAAFFHAMKAENTDAALQSFSDEAEIICIEQRQAILQAPRNHTASAVPEETDIASYVERMISARLIDKPTITFSPIRDHLTAHALGERATRLFWKYFSNEYAKYDKQALYADLSAQLLHLKTRLTSLRLPCSLNVILFEYENMLSEQEAAPHELIEKATRAVVTKSFYAALSTHSLSAEDRNTCTARLVAANEAIESLLGEYKYTAYPPRPLTKATMEHIIQGEARQRQHASDCGYIPREPSPQRLR